MPPIKLYDLARIRQTGLCFENLTLNEDTVFNIRYFTEAPSAYLLAMAPYHYGKRLESSVTSRFVPDYYELQMLRVRMIYDTRSRVLEFMHCGGSKNFG